MQTMDQNLVMLVDQKLISQSEAEKYAESPNLFTRRSAAVAVQTS
jgi:Tfp pilus assembly ATPase PilU